MMEEISPGFYVETKFPPYNLVLITTPDGGVVVDLPPSPVDAMNWLEQARGVVGTVRYAVLTSAGRDRQLATAVCNVPIIATEASLRIMQTYDEERARRDFIERLTNRYPEEVEALDELRPRKPAVAFDEHFTLYREGRTLEFEIIEGAGPGSLSVYVPEEELLIAGDTVVAADAVPPMGEAPDSKAWLNTMTTLAHRQHLRHIIAGRGQPWIVQAEIEPQREFMRVMRRAARTLARRTDNGLNLSQTAQELAQTFFNGQGQKAVKEIRAGLERLVTEVEMQTEDDEDDES